MRKYTCKGQSCMMNFPFAIKGSFGQIFQCINSHGKLFIILHFHTRGSKRLNPNNTLEVFTFKL